MITIIDTPSAVCGLPQRERLCVSMTCGAALSPRLAHRVYHATRCAFDVPGALIADKRRDPSVGDPLMRRRDDCAREDACLRAWVRADHDDDDQARCPDVCLGYVTRGTLVPASALMRTPRATVAA